MDWFEANILLKIQLIITQLIGQRANLLGNCDNLLDTCLRKESTEKNNGQLQQQKTNELYLNPSKQTDIAHAISGIQFRRNFGNRKQTKQIMLKHANSETNPFILNYEKLLKNGLEC